jgi:DNA-binding response OmpR family regulator
MIECAPHAERQSSPEDRPEDLPEDSVTGMKTGVRSSSQGHRERSGGISHPAVLVVDDDPGTCETFSTALRAAGYSVTIVVSGVDALSCLRASDFDAAVIDLRLPDMSGMTILSSLRTTNRSCAFILISAFLTTRVTVEAMRLGACDVLEKPIDIDALYHAVAAAVENGRSVKADGVSAEGVCAASGQDAPHSSVHRWAHVVLQACDVESDPKTLNDWAHATGHSYSSLRELCRIVDVRAHDARDLARMLRAIVMARGSRCSPKLFLDVGDERTVRLLFRRAGLDPSRHEVSLDDFFRQQQFVRFEHPGLQLLRELCSASGVRAG